MTAHAPTSDFARIKAENDTLYAVINTVSSSLNLDRVLDGVVEIATEATACHACFVYFVEGDRLVLRAASPMYRFFVGKLGMGLDEGLTGWVARNGTPEFIRDQALADPRMKYMPELEEERFQSMCAVPVASKDGAVIGVIVLHTAAPREFGEEVLNLLVHVASLVAGAIENAKLFADTQRRVDALTGLSRLSQRLAAAVRADELYEAVAEGVRGLLPVDGCHVYRVEADGDELVLAASRPDDADPPRPRLRGTRLLAEVLGSADAEEPPAGAATALWPGLPPGPVLIAPLVVSDEHLGVLCARAGGERPPSAEDARLFRAVANQAAVAIKKAELIERLAAENAVKDLFTALAAGSADVAEAHARTVGFDLGRPHAHAVAVAAPGTEASWAAVAERLELELRATAPSALIEVGHDRLRAILPLGDGADGAERLRDALDPVASGAGATLGLGGPAAAAADGRRGLREAGDAARIDGVLHPAGGAAAYDHLGAYRYLVHLPLDEAPRDRHWQAVERLADYDRRRRSHLVDTLEQYLTERRSVAASARALFIHPNTLRQRLARIEKVSGLTIGDEDLLSLELAVKLVRLQRAAGSPRSSGAPTPGGGDRA